MHKLKFKRERINGNSDATREEKEEALKQVDTLVNHSFITINNVNKNQEVYDTKDKTIEAIHKNQTNINYQTTSIK